MPGQNKIYLGYNLDTLTPDTLKVVEQLNAVYEAAEKLDGRKMNPDISGVKGLNKAYADQGKALDEVGLAVNQYNKLVTEMATTKAKAAAATSTQAENLAIEKAQLQQTNQELKNSAQYLIANTGSVNEAIAANKRLVAERNALGDAEGKNSEKIKELNAVINQNNEFIKRNSSALEQQKQNVGNYAGSMAPAFKILSGELDSIRQKLSNMKPTDSGFEKLAQEEKLLSKLTEDLSKGFTSTKSELRAFTEAAKVMGTEFGVADARFQEFVNEVGERKDELTDIQNTINFSASDTKYLDGIVDAVTGLAGAYGAAQAATQLLGADNEELQKGMAKMQAIMTLVTSLQAMMNAVQTDGAAVQTFLAIKTKLLAASEFVLGTSKQILTTVTAENTVVTEASAIAMTEQAIANEGAEVAAIATSVALGVETAATEVAEEATISLAATFAATGIGAIIIALAAGVAYLAVKTYDWIHADERAAEAQAKLAESSKVVIDAINGEIEAVKVIAEQRKKSLVDELSAAEKSGQNQEKLFAIKKKIAEYDKKAADDAMSRNGMNDKEFRFIQTTYEGRALAVKNYSERILEAKRIESDNDLNGSNNGHEDIGLLEKKLEQNKKELNSDKATFDQQKKLRDDKANADKASNELAIEQAKFTADEQRKIKLESTRLEADLVQSKNAIILGDERSTQSQRIAAMRSNLEQQKVIAKAELNDVLNNSSSTEGDKILAKKKFNEESKKLNISEKDEERKLNLDYAHRKIEAEKALNDTILTEDEAANKRISSSDAFSLEERLEALKKSNADKQQMLTNDYNKQKAIKVMTAEELKALDADYAAKSKALSIQTESDLISIQLSAFEKMKKDADDYYKDTEKDAEVANARQTLDTQMNYAKQKKELNDKFLAGTIGLEKYNREVKKLEENGAKQALRDVQANLQAQLAAEKIGYDNSLKAKADLEQKIAELSGKGVLDDQQSIELQKLKDKLHAEEVLQKDHELKINAIKSQSSKNDEAIQQKDVDKKKEAQAKVLASTTQLIDKSVNLIQTLVDSGYENELNALQKVKDQTDENYATELKNIEGSNLSQQDKAARTVQIQAEQKARDKQLEREQRDIKNRQAKADRAFSIAQIVEQTAVAIVSALKLPPPFNFIESGLIGALGAVQLATILSKPIPQYAEGAGINGKPLHQGGLAIVGEGKFKERVTTPDNHSFIADRATLLNLPKGTKVEPLSIDDMTRIMYSGMERKSRMIEIAEQKQQAKAEEKDYLLRENNQLLRKLLEKDTSVKTVNKVSVDMGWTNYINQQVFGK